MVSCVPTKLTIWPTYRRRKSRDSRSGVTSASRRRTTEDRTGSPYANCADPEGSESAQVQGQGTAGSALGLGTERLVDDYEELLDARLHSACPFRVRLPVGPGQRRREHFRHHSLFRRFPRKTGVLHGALAGGAPEQVAVALAAAPDRDRRAATTARTARAAVDPALATARGHQPSCLQHQGVELHRRQCRLRRPRVHLSHEEHLAAPDVADARDDLLV